MTLGLHMQSVCNWWTIRPIIDDAHQAELSIYSHIMYLSNDLITAWHSLCVAIIVIEQSVKCILTVFTTVFVELAPYTIQPFQEDYKT